MRILLLIVAILLFAHAQADDGYATFGPGMLSCGEWVDYRRDDSLKYKLSVT